MVRGLSYRIFCKGNCVVRRQPGGVIGFTDNFRLDSPVIFRYYPLVLVLVVVDDKLIESPTLWNFSVDPHYPLDDVKLDPSEVESQAKAERFGICFLQRPHPEKSLELFRFWYRAIQQVMLEICQLLLVSGRSSKKVLKTRR